VTLLGTKTGMVALRAANSSPTVMRHDRANNKERTSRAGWGPGRGKWRLLLPGASEPRLTRLRRQGFNSVFQAALRSLSNRSIVVVGNYSCGPITAEPCRAKARPLHPRRSYFAPAKGPDHPSLWWRRRVPPPGPKGLLRRPFIAIAGSRRHTQYRAEWLTKKGPSVSRASESGKRGTRAPTSARCAG
jgi:hypothetical protein